MNIQLQIYVLACFDLQQVKTSVTQKKCFSVNKIFEPLHSIGRGLCCRMMGYERSFWFVKAGWWAMKDHFDFLKSFKIPNYNQM